MTRNTEKRVEIAFPVENSVLKKKIIHILDIMLNDNVKARKINDKGEYERVIRSVDLIDSQYYFMQDDLSKIEEEQIISESFFTKLKNLVKRKS